MKRVLRFLAVCSLCAIEPTFHALGIPHPEGVTGMALNYLAPQER